MHSSRDTRGPRSVLRWGSWTPRMPSRYEPSGALLITVRRNKMLWTANNVCLVCEVRPGRCRVRLGVSKGSQRPKLVGGGTPSTPGRPLPAAGAGARPHKQSPGAPSVSNQTAISTDDGHLLGGRAGCHGLGTGTRALQGAWLTRRRASGLVAGGASDGSMQQGWTRRQTTRGHFITRAVLRDVARPNSEKSAHTARTSQRPAAHRTDTHTHAARLAAVCSLHHVRGWRLFAGGRHPPPPCSRTPSQRQSTISSGCLGDPADTHLQDNRPLYLKNSASIGLTMA
ncbi:hypothetical protein F5X68DRAFT_13035 [Plectosphaerella plurivora]|uniref:Uncharacterized protein n=1 Tax=Plectosphaerella plurivora TaxID=936078 RepID=A0A9P8V9S2_9PEZI|nr:hypothetical protein F5X68DRAFT_13035 [Plectosphaerella plurivora]